MKFEKLIRAAGVAALLFGLSTASQAQGPGGGRLEVLGDSHVDGAVDHDKIQVGRYDGAFRAIQIRVEGGAVRFQRVIVHFGNGGDMRVQMRSVIPDGGQTRIIDLPGDRRLIKSVEFWYAKASWNRRPTVTLLGLR